MEQTKYQKYLRILCILGIILNSIAAVLTLGAAVIGIIGLNTPGVDLSAVANGTINGQAMTTGQALTALGVLGVVMGILYAVNVVACAFGLRGAKDPSKIKPFFNIVLVLTILQAIVIVIHAVSGDVSGNRFVSLAFDVMLLFLANNIKQQA